MFFIISPSQKMKEFLKDKALPNFAHEKLDTALFLFVFIFQIYLFTRSFFYLCMPSQTNAMPCLVILSSITTVAARSTAA